MNKTPSRLLSAVCAILTLAALIPFTALAEPIPEKDIVGETVCIEPDENIIHENIVDGDPDVSRELETDRVISLDKKTYFGRFVLPVILIMLAAVTVFVICESIRGNERGSAPNPAKKTF